MNAATKKTLTTRPVAGNVEIPVVARNASGFNIAESGLTIILGLAYEGPGGYVPRGIVVPKNSSKKKFTAREWLRIIDKLPKETSCVSFACGKAASISYLPVLIARANSKGVQTHIETSGDLLTRDFAKKLKNSGLDTIAVNIEPPGAGTRDKLKGRAGTEKVISGITDCLREGLACGIYTHATKANLKDGGLKKTIQLAEGLGLHFVRILPPEPAGSLPGLKRQMLDGKERKALKSLLRKGFSVLEDEHCLAVDKKLVCIFPDGDVSPCPSVPFSFGNAGKVPLKTILKRMWKHPMCGIRTKGCVMYNEEFMGKYLQEIDLSRYFPVTRG